MDFRIADTFTDSLTALTAEEQKAVKTTAFDLQMDPSNPGMQFHRLDRVKDENFWSVRVNRGVRIIVHRTSSSLLLCYTGHHDDAYRWAERRKIERHPKTGAAQLVEIRETVREIEIPQYVAPEEPPKPLLFPDVPEEELLSYGVPPEWVKEVRGATEDTLFDLAEHLPNEAAEALLDLAVGSSPRVAEEIEEHADPFEHPDAQRRFRVITNVEELERALDYPWERWMVFLHPSQRELVEREYAGPARISGSAGTGKTIVALHRAVHLARTHPDTRILLTTFSETLANALRHRLQQLIGNEPRVMERLEVSAMGTIGRRLYAAQIGPAKLADDQEIRRLIAEAASEIGEERFTPHFLWTEWASVVDAWQLGTWEEYRDVKRLGRRTRLPEARREILWSIFEKVREELDRENFITEATLFSRLAEKLHESGRSPFDFAVIDEAQDMSVPQLRFLAALAGGRANGLFFTGDLGQRIFQQPFSWSSLGVEIRGRSHGLRINYRTSHQIRHHADRLLDPEIADVDGVVEDRRGTISVFNGPPPAVRLFDSEEEESEAVGEWIRARLDEGVPAEEIAVFVRSDAQLPRAEAAAKAADAPHIILDEKMRTRDDHISITTMHLAKGLEYRAVAVIACDDEVLPLQERIESVSDESDLEDVYQTERHLLYVACTRAREHLLVTGVGAGSEFLEDLGNRRWERPPPEPPT
ncbi:MAG: UvrD-helicase domain-containing protein [Acidobacteria bacterium]|nr:UvrD-helicase domain-containing protein [Acidobacteriota bacterium]